MFFFNIDEIYTAKRVEYSAGNILGLTSYFASTLLCFWLSQLQANTEI